MSKTTKRKKIKATKGWMNETLILREKVKQLGVENSELKKADKDHLSARQGLEQRLKEFKSMHEGKMDDYHEVVVAKEVIIEAKQDEINRLATVITDGIDAPANTKLKKQLEAFGKLPATVTCPKCETKVKVV